MFISEVQNKNALQRTLISRRAMTESARLRLFAVTGCADYAACLRFEVFLRGIVRSFFVERDLRKSEIIFSSCFVSGPCPPIKSTFNSFFFFILNIFKVFVDQF
jgi:hypothetical protein